LIVRPLAIVLSAGLLVAVPFMLPQSTHASSIPTLTEGEHVLVAVEPLLQTMQIAYRLDDGRLSVGDRAYIGPMVVDAGLHYAEPRAIAAFLNLNVTYPNGVITFEPPAPRSGSDAASPDPDALQALRARLLARLNDHRASIGLAALTYDATAEAAAEYQAKDMETAGIMRHTDAHGRSPYERFASIGGRARNYGENVAYFGLDVTDVTNEWQAVDKLDAMMMAERPPEDGHREAILSTIYRQVGIGVAIGANGLYLAEDFVAK
jgi:uncharacterized protein YkwD